jgi:AraC-like DNA-binding protein
VPPAAGPPAPGAAGTAPERFPGLLSGFHVEGDPSGADSGLLHGGESWASTSYFIEAHTHPGWEVYLQAFGRSRWRAGSETVELLPGHVLAVPPRLRHSMTDRPAARHHFFYAGFDLDRVARRHGALRLAWEGAGLLHHPDGTALDAPFRSLVRELGHRMPLPEVGVATALDALVLEATRLLRTSGGHALLGTVHPAVARARALLDSRYQEHWSMPELAREVGLSTAHLAEIFSREVGVPPFRYLVERRVQRAAELLRGTDLPITAIALELGFASSSHFSRVFKSLAHVTPRDFRQTARTAGQ